MTIPAFGLGTFRLKDDVVIASVKTALACGFTKMSSIEVPIQNLVFLQDIVEHRLNDRACVSTSLLFLFARKAL